MEKQTIVILLVVAVIGYFVITSGNLKAPTFAVVPSTTDYVSSDVACTTVTDCVEPGMPTDNVQCDKVCKYQLKQIVKPRSE
jgi:hypothetical protein